MEINRILKITVLLILLTPFMIFSENYSGYNLPYYDQGQGIGGTPSGLGGAFVAVADDGNTPFYNPAGLPDIGQKMFTLNYRKSFIENANLFYFSYLYDLAKTQGIGFSFLWSGISDLLQYNEDQEFLGLYPVSRFQVGISYGFLIMNNLNLGFSAKYFYHSIFKYFANSVDFDFGLMFHIISGLKFGFVLQNFIPLGFQLREKGASEDIPLTMRTGFSYKPIRSLLFTYELEKTVLSPFSATPYVHHMGMRYSPFELFAINAGYDMENFFVGLNLNLEKIRFYLGSVGNLASSENNMNLGVSYVFPKQEDSTDAITEVFYQGVVAYQNKDYRMAIRYFQRVLDKRYDPTAEYYLKNARAYLESEEWMSAEEREIVDMKVDHAKKLQDNQEYGKSIKSLREVLDINPENEEADVLMKKAKNTVQPDVDQYFSQAKDAFENGNNKLSYNKAELALSLNPEHKPSIELQEKNSEVLKDVISKEHEESRIKMEAKSLYDAGMGDLKSENWKGALDNFEKSYKLVQDATTKQYLKLAETQLEETKKSKEDMQKSEVHYKIGLSYFKKNKMKEARTEFQNAINIYPENKDAQDHLRKINEMIDKPLADGQQALRENRLAEAMDNFNKVLKIDPDNVIAKQSLKKSKDMVKGSIENNLRSGKTAYNKEEYAKALQHYKNVVKLDSKNEEAKEGKTKSLAKLQDIINKRLADGVNAFNNKKFRDAIKKLEKVLELDSENITAKDYLAKAQKEFAEHAVAYTIEEHMETGIEFFQNKNYKQAETYFNKVIGLDQKNQEAYEYLRKCKTEIKKQEIQEKTAKIIVEGIKLTRRKKFDEAIAKLKEAKDVDPENELIDEYIEYAIKAKKSSENKSYNDGIRYMKEGNLIKARENLEKAAKDKKNQDARKKLAEVNGMIFEKVTAARTSGINKFDAGNYNDALKDINEFLKFEPGNDQMLDYQQMTDTILEYLENANKSMSSGDYGEAIDNYENILRYNKKDEKVKRLKAEASAKGKRLESKWFNEGLSFYEKGDLREAEKRFQRVKNINPDHTEAKNNLAKVKKAIDIKAGSDYKTGKSYYDRKDYKNAISKFNEVLKLKDPYKDTKILLSKARKEYNKQKSVDRDKIDQKIQDYFLDGINYYKSDKLPEAIREWNKVLKLDPGNIKALKYINRAKYKLRELEKLK